MSATKLAGSLANLSTALGEVNDFVKTNREVLGRDIKGLNRVAKVLVKQRANLDEVLGTAPLALNNLYLTYNPQAGTLDTNANIGNLESQLVNDPSLLLCTVVNSVDPTGGLCDVVQDTLPRPVALDVLRGEPTGATAGPDPFDQTLGGLVEVNR